MLRPYEILGRRQCQRSRHATSATFFEETREKRSKKSMEEAGTSIDRAFENLGPLAQPVN